MEEVGTWPQAERQDHVEPAQRHARMRYSHDIVKAGLASICEQELAARQRRRTRREKPDADVVGRRDKWSGLGLINEAIRGDSTSGFARPVDSSLRRGTISDCCSST